PAARRLGKVGGFGTANSIICSPASRTRHVALLYLLPSDFATSESGHGDRYAEVLPQLRQAMFDVAAVIDTRAGQLAPGSRRRTRVLCEDDGQPRVERIVLPHTAAEYLSSSGGFTLMMDDLEALGHLPEYAGYYKSHSASLRRVLGYYDGEFEPGFAGQGTLFRRSSLLKQGMRASDPLIGRTTRNINNNPPSGSFAVQYGTRFDGIPDAPLYTSMLHELSHTMGAVQDEPATSSDAGHCVDGLDVMCYFDSPSSTYVETACPDAAAPRTPEDELFDCNGDTYFHPAPAAGTPLAAATTWHLGLPANETLSTDTTGTPAPGAVTGLSAGGTGTRITLRWGAVAGASGYEVAYRAPGAAWSYLAATSPSAAPSLKPGTAYEFAVGAFNSALALGPRATATRTTGLDTSPPNLPSGLNVASKARTSARLKFVLSADNVRVTRYVVERLVGRRWVTHSTVPAPAARIAVAGDVVTTPSILRFKAGTAYRLRLRAQDARGNRSAPSRVVLLVTRR
ncbi:MAG: hypothetical protein JWM86_179, partial [Thermoleophilia bacterium]|nr:hypothetical protein [Thermoleophilia bacterium]